jgi:hypothetical protein
MNVYYSHVASAIYLPRTSLGFPSELNDILRGPRIRAKVELAIQVEIDITGAKLKVGDKIGELSPYSDEQIDLALAAFIEELGSSSSPGSGASNPEVEDEFVHIRELEFQKIRESLSENHLQVRKVPIDSYSKWMQGKFDRVNLIDELRETRVLYGFSRIKPEPGKSVAALRSMLWRKEPDFNRTWLPAYIVKGEGIYLELNSEKVAEWEQRPAVVERLQVLLHNYDELKAKRGLGDHAILPRFVLLHTLAHLILNQLTFDCGYSSASLRERLFCGVGAHSMSGLMVYTAAGDSEGTMGGLVRMGQPGVFDVVLGKALMNASWCSSDPVCMELGAHGQGPDSCNLAACHSCALVPETSCESFNKFLDRALVIGTPEQPEAGFFDLAELRA